MTVSDGAGGGSGDGQHPAGSPFEGLSVEGFSFRDEDDELDDDLEDALEPVSFVEMAAEFEAVGLPHPLTPPLGAGELFRSGPLHAFSDGVPGDLYDVDPDEVFGEWLVDPTQRGWAVAFQGRGRVSWAMHQVVLDERVAVFAQLACERSDGIDAPGDSSGNRFAAAVLADLAGLIDAAHASSTGTSRVAVWCSDFHGDRWAAIAPVRVASSEISWNESPRESMLAAAADHLALEDTDDGKDGAMPESDEGTQDAEPTVDDFLACTDIDELAELATAFPLEDAERRTIMRVVGSWDRPVAVANLLMHPRLLGSDYRADVISRALTRGAGDYLTFAALVGLTNERHDIVDADDDIRLLAAIVPLAGQSDQPLVAGRAAAVLAGHATHVDPSDIVPLLSNPDVVVRHNAVVALVRRVGLADAVRSLSGVATDDPEIAGWVGAAHDELAVLSTDDDVAATPFGGIRGTWVPPMSEWAST